MSKTPVQFTNTSNGPYHLEEAYKDPKIGITFKTVTVTPYLANVWLKNNFVNRRCDRKTVAAFARDMVAGNWKLLPSGALCFAPDGALLNGQHRLNAVIKAGRGVDFFIAENVPADFQLYMDKLRPRRVSDNLHMFHGVPRKYAAKVSYIARYIIAFETGVWDKANETSAFGVWTRYHSDIIWFFEHAPLFPWSKGAYFAGPIIFFHKHMPFETEKFVADMALCDRSKKNTVSALVKVLQSPKLRTGGNKGFDMALRIFNSFAAYLDGRDLIRIYRSTIGYDQVKELFGFTSHSPEFCVWSGCSSEKGDKDQCWVHKNYGNSKARARRAKERYDY